MLDRLMGGEIVSRLPGRHHAEDRRPGRAGCAERSREPYVIPGGGSNPVGALGPTSPAPRNC